MLLVCHLDSCYLSVAFLPFYVVKCFILPGQPLQEEGRLPVPLHLLACPFSARVPLAAERGAERAGTARVL